MLALTGAVRIWHITTVQDMRLGKYRLLEAAKRYFPNVYNGDAYAFMSKDRRKVKIVRYDHDRIVLYDISYIHGLAFMKPVFNDGKLVHQLDFKYLAALLSCPVRKNLEVKVI